MLSLVFVRLRNSLVLLTLATLLCFALVVSAPGNIAVLIAELRTPKATFEQIQKIEVELGLNDPLLTRYGNWLAGAFEGDLGISYKTGEDIGPAMGGRLSTTAILVAGGACFAMILSFLLGFAGALWPGRFADSFSRGVALLGASMPSFFVGALLIYGLAVELRLFPTFGAEGLSSWVLPWITIGLLPAAVLSRVVRVGLEEAMSRPFTLTAAAKGLTRRSILFRHALPNIAPTYINALGAQSGAMVVGAIVVEPLFALKGVADLFLAGVLFRDFMVVQACLLVFISFFILLNLTVDIGMMFTDPKLRRQGS
ncbi:ABC transporter permease [Mesorhizobium sp.]|uniref:ABC transporter permease n=1 Tax=Mesorhizobium sp. TaxID=1871066 RepID=UPI000FE770AB|nr:ABC transporter permease [Mesorhizobium sp.]RWK43092.1 MAG: ABC transporter permease [Mesorhizobium sp.]RWK67993.1 MAG: ABC transporter permease [Mesorhizobium sp.]RWK73864.1 MAG: ABC transporter permease [Mesorhizobium sp.]RWK81113.1 MAG: ABC transporter permease [Mesorhizobium sp.]RWL08435.1 MAG: ABC transporter permease [Mesorhizobium sp.]